MLCLRYREESLFVRCTFPYRCTSVTGFAVPTMMLMTRSVRGDVIWVNRCGCPRWTRPRSTGSSTSSNRGRSGPETADCVAVLQPDFFSGQVRDRFFAGAADRDETALVISLLGYARDTLLVAAMYGQLDSVGW